MKLDGLPSWSPYFGILAKYHRVWLLVGFREDAMLQHTLPILNEAEGAAARRSVDKTLALLRQLSLDEFGEFIISLPRDEYPALTAMLPAMASEDIQKSWTGASGMEIAKAIVDLRATGREQLRPLLWQTPAQQHDYGFRLRIRPDSPVDVLLFRSRPHMGRRCLATLARYLRRSSDARQLCEIRKCSHVATSWPDAVRCRICLFGLHSPRADSGRRLLSGSSPTHEGRRAIHRDGPTCRVLEVS